MADQHQRGAGRLGKSRQLRGAFAHLRYAARRGLQRLGIDGLDRVDHRDVGLLRHQYGQNLLELDFRQQVERRRIHRQAAGAQRNLLRGLLAAYIDRIAAAAKNRQRLQQQRGFADAGIAAEQHYRACHQPAAKHPVQLADAGQPARLFECFDFA